MKLRSEDDAQSCTPIRVKLGTADYDIPLLTVMPQREWRKKLFAELSPILLPLDEHLGPETPSTDVLAFLQRFRKGVSEGLTSSLLQYPDKLIELVFAYREYGLAFNALLKDGPANDAELNAAFVEVLKKPLPEADDFKRRDILAGATEEQIACAFSAIMAVAFPSLPQIEMVRNLMRSTAASRRSSQPLANSTN